MKMLQLAKAMAVMVTLFTSSILYGYQVSPNSIFSNANNDHLDGEVHPPVDLLQPPYTGTTPLHRGRTPLDFIKIIDSEFKLPIFPVIFMVSDSGRTITNLCETPLNKLGKWVVEEDGFQLLDEDCPKGYKVVQYRQKSSGLGAGLKFAFETATSATRIFSADVGIIPIKGRSLKMERFAESRVAARELPPLNFPYAATDIDTWSQGDSVSFMASGGLLTYASISFGGMLSSLIARFSTSYLAQGDWIVDISKIDKTKVFVRITKSKIRALSAAVGNIVSSLSITKFKNTDDSFSYVMDLSDPVAAKVYEDTVRGNLLPVQERVKGSSNSAVYAVAKEHSFTRTRRKRAYVSLPFIVSKEWNRGQMIKDSETFLFADNKKVDTEYGIFYKSSLRISRNGRFKHHISVLKNFSGTRYAITGEENPKDNKSGYFGEIQFSYTNDDTARNEFQKGLWHLYSATGLKDYLRVKAPKTGALGHAGILLSAYIPQGAVDTLMELAEQDHELFEKSQSMRSIKYYLLKMSKSKNQDSKRFVENFAHFGRFMISNRSTFKTVLAAAPELIKLKYRVEGEKFYSYERIFTFADLEDVEDLEGEEEVFPVANVD